MRSCQPRSHLAKDACSPLNADTSISTKTHLCIGVAHKWDVCNLGQTCACALITLPVDVRATVTLSCSISPGFNSLLHRSLLLSAVLRRWPTEAMNTDIGICHTDIGRLPHAAYIQRVDMSWQTPPGNFLLQCLPVACNILHIDHASCGHQSPKVYPGHTDLLKTLSKPLFFFIIVTSLRAISSLKGESLRTAKIIKWEKIFVTIPR